MLPLLLPANTANPHPLPLLASSILLEGYQLYAVEKWLVQPERFIHHLVVYTGDPTHTILVDALGPPESVPEHLWQSAIEILRADGAKPRHTPHGILMVTSLAHFRSDYTIVHIPSGCFLDVRDQLYCNINLLRMGCSGRTALTLEDPSDSTKDRFLAAYHLPDVSFSDPLPPSPPLSPTRSNSTRNVRPMSWKDRGPNHSTSSLPTKTFGRTKERTTFITTVLELVKLVQSALSLFGLFSAPISGLLCDATVDAIRNWTTLYGAPFAGLEPSERIADPLFVAAIFSLVLSIRNKLIHLGYAHVVPRDPFLHTYAFSMALTNYIQSTAPLPLHSNHSVTIAVPHLSMAYFSQPHSAHSQPPSTASTITPSQATTATTPGTALPVSSSNFSTTSSYASSTPTGSTLTCDLVESISAAYDKSKADHHSSKVKRVLKNRLAPPLTDHHHHHLHHRTAGLGESDSAMDDPSPRRVSNNLGLSLALGSGSASGSGGGPSTAGLSTAGSGGANSDTSPLQSSGLSTGGIGSSGGQIFTGIGSLASGLVLGPGSASHGSGMGVSELMHPTLDLSLFVRILLSKDGGGSGSHHHGPLGRGRKGKEAKRESMDLSLGYQYSGSAKGEKDGSVAGSLKALWSGRVGDIVKMREIEADMDSKRSLFGSERDRPGSWKRTGLPLSDDEVERRGKVRYDGKSTEDDSDAPHSGSHFGGMFSGRVRGKLGNWTGLARRKHQSVDLSPQGKERPSRLMIPNIRPAMVRRSTTGGGSRAQSPTLPPFGDVEDEDLLSSGQVSPLSDNRPSNFNMIRPINSRTAAPISPTGGSSTSNLTSLHSLNPQDSERAFAQLLSRKKRPWEHRRLSHNNNNNLPPGTGIGVGSRDLPSGGSARISSWADPVSARDFMDEYHNTSGGDGSGPDEGKRATRPRQPPPPQQHQRQKRGRDDLSVHVETEVDSDVSGGPGSILNGVRQTASASVPDGLDTAGASRWRKRERARFHSLLSVVDGDGFLLEEPLEEEDEDPTRRRQRGGLGDRDGVEDEDEEEDGDDDDFYYYYYELDGPTSIGSRLGIGDEAVGAGTASSIKRRKKWFLNPRRRWSFHDIEDFKDIDTLTVERMKVDVNLCGQLLVMLRREEQTQTMMQCMKVLIDSMQTTNTLIREHYETHFEPLSEIEGRSRILLDMEECQTNADRVSQATHTLRYEAEQFHTPDLWHTASQSRRKVFALREKVFGMGGRRLAPGVHGAHDGFNRLEWTLDGEGRLVDYLGRTESEAEEEDKIVGGDRGTSAAFMLEGAEEEEEGDVIEHPGIKPMWLLRFFTGWSARWSAAAGRGVAANAGGHGSASAAGGTSPTTVTSPPPGLASEDEGVAVLPTSPVVVEKGKQNPPKRGSSQRSDGGMTSPGSFKTAGSDRVSPSPLPSITVTNPQRD